MDYLVAGPHIEVDLDIDRRHGSPREVDLPAER